MRKQLVRAVFASGTMLGVGLYGPTLLPGTDMVGTQRGIAPGGVGGHVGIGSDNPGGNIEADGRNIGGDASSTKGSAAGMPHMGNGNQPNNAPNSAAPIDGTSGDLGTAPDNPDDSLKLGSGGNGSGTAGVNGR